MQAIIEQVLDEEEKARQQIETARKNASAVKSKTDEETNEVLLQARTQASALTKERLEKARREAQELIQRLSSEEEKKSLDLYEASRTKMQSLAQEISLGILKSDIQED